jgi:hypothetical protein
MSNRRKTLREGLGESLGAVDEATDRVLGQGAPRQARKPSEPRSDDDDFKPTIHGKSRTDGGLLKRTVYFHEDEWRAVLERAHTDDLSAAQVVRRAVRESLGLG